MSEEHRVITGIALGAVLGAVAAYLVFTPHGRRALENVEGTLDDLAGALERFRRALRRADGVVHEARGAVDDVRTMLKGEDLAAGVQEAAVSAATRASSRA